MWNKNTIRMREKKTWETFYSFRIVILYFAELVILSLERQTTHVSIQGIIDEVKTIYSDTDANVWIIWRNKSFALFLSLCWAHIGCATVNYLVPMIFFHSIASHYYYYFLYLLSSDFASFSSVHIDMNMETYSYSVSRKS